MSKPRLSVILITKNEAHQLQRCLGSVAFADEIIVVDSGSTDGTQALARSLGAQVIETDWPGFGPQKNRALNAATGDWVLSIDADEHLTPELAQAVQQAMLQDEIKAFEIARFSSYCGRYMRHSGWWPDPILRLFKRGVGKFTDDKVHERVVVEGTKTGKLQGLLLHESYVDSTSVIAKMNHYSTLSAQQMYARGKRATLGTAIGHGLWMFIRTYLLKRGFLDGVEGFMVAVSNAENSYYRYIKLRQLQLDAQRKGRETSA